MDDERMIEMAFKRYLDSKGVCITDVGLRELVEIYLDCQDWDGDTLISGKTELEMFDWIKHTSEVEQITNNYTEQVG